MQTLMGNWKVQPQTEECRVVEALRGGNHLLREKRQQTAKGHLANHPQETPTVKGQALATKEKMCQVLIHHVGRHELGLVMYNLPRYKVVAMAGPV